MAEIRISQLPILVETDAQVVRVSSLPILVELDQRMVRVSQCAVLVEIELYTSPVAESGGGRGDKQPESAGEQTSSSEASTTTGTGTAAPSARTQPGGASGTTTSALQTQPAARPVPNTPTGRTSSGSAPAQSGQSSGSAAKPGEGAVPQQNIVGRSAPTQPSGAPRAVSASAAAAQNRLFGALAASRAAVPAGISPGTSGGTGVMASTKRTIVSTVWIDWDRDGGYTEETAYLVSASGTVALTAPEQMLAGGRGAVASCQVVLDNKTRRFSPANSAGALYAAIAAGGAYMAPIQVKVNISGTLYVLFAGYVREMTESAPTPTQPGTVTLDCRTKDDKLLQDKISTELADFLADSATMHTEDFHIINLLETAGMVDGTDFVSQAYTNELTTNGSFASDLTGWSGANWAYEAGVDGQARHTAGATAALTQNVTVVGDLAYRVVIGITDVSAGSVAVSVGGVTLSVNGATALTADAIGTFRAAASGAVALNITPTTDFDGAVTSISINLAATIDNGIFPMQYVWLDDESVLDELWTLVAACCGWFYCDHTGKFHYHNITGVLPESLQRHYGALTTLELDESQVAGLQLRWPTAELYNEISVEISPRGAGEAGEIWTPDDPIVVQPGDTKTVWCRLDSAQVTTPVLSYQAYTAGGIEYDDVTVAQTDYAQRVKLVIENTGTKAAYFNTLTLSGQMLDGGRTLEIEETSGESFWTGRPTRRRSVRNNVYIQSEAQAQTIAAYTLRRQELPILLASVPGVDRADVRIGHPVEIEYGDAVVETIAGIVAGIAWRMDSTGYHQDLTVLETGSLFADADPIFILGTHRLGDVSDPDEAYLFY